MLYFKPIPPDHKQTKPTEISLYGITAKPQSWVGGHRKHYSFAFFSFQSPRETQPARSGQLWTAPLPPFPYWCRPSQDGRPTRPAHPQDAGNVGCARHPGGSQSPDTAASASTPFAPLDRGEPAAESRGHWRRLRKRPCDRQPRPPAGSRA